MRHQRSSHLFKIHYDKRLPGLVAAGLMMALALLTTMHVTAASGEPGGPDDQCAGCHHNLARLESLSSRGNKVYVNPALYAGQIHGGLACTTCHGGNPAQDDPQLACVGIAYKNPASADVVQQTCGANGCHPDITARHQKSIHATMNGHKISLVNLLGKEAGSEKFEGTCIKCHASCAECHMEEPGAHGLLFPRVISHQFAPESNPQNCWTCHGGTGDTFFGEAGNPEHGPSAMARAGMQCMDCHREQEIHGDGSEPRFIADSPKPECDDCHQNPANFVLIGNKVAVAPQYSPQNPAHAIHTDEAISCVSCHTEWYPSCWNCHQGREERAVYELFLAVNPITGKIHAAAHSPAAGPDWGGASTEIGGGWAIKSRHSWGNARPCETCHANPGVFIEGIDRQARFVGVWNQKEKNATFVPPEQVALLTIDLAGFRQSAHGQFACNDCHQTLTDEGCTGCHTGAGVDMPAEADWTRTGYIDARENLARAKELMEHAAQLNIATASWQADWATLKESYLQTANQFHADPGPAQIAIQDVALQTRAVLPPLNQALETQALNRQRVIWGVPLLVGGIGAVALAVTFYRPKKKIGEDK